MNTPYFRGSNEENAMATSPLAPPHTVNATPNRRVLGDVSTNTRVFSSPATGGLFSKKVMMGSPLKRSFTAAVEEGYGLKYLKKRRMSGDMGFGPVEPRAPNRIRRDDAGAVSRARSVPEAVATHHEPTGDFFHSPTEPNTPSDSGGETRGSFSSLIDFDPSSQHAVAPQSRHQQHLYHHDQPETLLYQQPPEEPHEEQQQEEEKEEGEDRSGLVFKSISPAETLQLRLRVAMYKIRTNQVHVPFAELQVEQDERLEEMNHRRVNEAVEEAVATMRREAMESMERERERKCNSAPTPTLIPGPLLHPTAYSSRTIYQPEPQALGPLAAASLFMSNQQMQGSSARESANEF